MKYWPQRYKKKSVLQRVQTNFFRFQTRFNAFQTRLKGFQRKYKGYLLSSVAPSSEMPVFCVLSSPFVPMEMVAGLTL